MMKHLLAFVAVIGFAPALVSAAPISRIVVFGDSLSDQGNAFALTGGLFPPAPYAGRASNGPVAVERLASQLGVDLAPAALGGTNYAVIGAATGPVVVPGTGGALITDNFAATAYGIPVLQDTGILRQVEHFALAGPSFASDTTLFVVWGGANDFFIDPSAASAARAVQNLATAIGFLYGQGARHFLVPNMPNLALTPSGFAAPPLQQAGLQLLSMGFNAGLGTALDALDVLPGIDIVRFDTFAFLTALTMNPAAYGFDNVASPCLSGNLATGGIQCATPDTYLFWDTVHPSARAHAILGDAFAQVVAPAAVPEPALLTLVMVGVAAGAARRRRAR